MTRDEFKILAKAMKAVYPQETFLPDQDAFNVWYSLLKDLPYKQASLAVEKYMVMEHFPPTIADIRTKANEIISPEAEGMSELAAWQLVVSAISNSSYNSLEEFARLPEACQRAVGTPATLREWASMDSQTVHSVEQSHFLRNYRAVLDQMKQEAKMPPAMREAIAQHKRTGFIEERQPVLIGGEDDNSGDI